MSTYRVTVTDEKTGALVQEFTGLKSSAVRKLLGAIQGAREIRGYLAQLTDAIGGLASVAERRRLRRSK
jgi:hypothetical protein